MLRSKTLFTYEKQTIIIKYIFINRLCDLFHYTLKDSFNNIKRHIKSFFKENNLYKIDIKKHDIIGYIWIISGFGAATIQILWVLT